MTFAVNFWRVLFGVFGYLESAHFIVNFMRCLWAAHQDRLDALTMSYDCL